jgi:hypothetical protein
LEAGLHASSGEDAIAVAKVASLLRYVSRRKLDGEPVGLRCEVKRLSEAGVRLKMIQNANREYTASSARLQSSLGT